MPVVELTFDTREMEAYFTALANPERCKKMKRKALRKGAAIIKASVEELAPERPDLPSGTALPVGAVKADIHVRLSTQNQTTEVATISPGKETEFVQSLVEFGHQQVAGGKLGLDGKGEGHRVGTHGMTSTFVPPHPFWRPAIEASAESAASAIEESLLEDLDKETITDTSDVA
jgi:Bacteriophage HK97-gp10, putative tail-component